MKIKTQLSIAEIEFVVRSVPKRGMHKAAVLLLTVIIIAIGFILSI